MKIGDMVMRVVNKSQRRKATQCSLNWVRTTGIVTEIDFEYGRWGGTIPGTPPGFYKVVWQDGGSSWYRSNQVEVISENR